ncbi:MAG: DUF1289 domain-containing protein [Hyphomicrobiales bacterium]|nr:DUF1289 domain-containing protein [Hyphomicrobiales bacterium]
MSTPCILVCAIDDTTGYCFGCGRTSDEIGMWTRFHENERQEIMSALDARLATVKRKPKRETRRRRMARQHCAPSNTMS